MNKTIIATILGITALVALSLTYFIFIDSDTETQQEFDSTSVQEKQNNVANADQTTLESKLIIGRPEAKVSIVEYADYKCPNCNEFSRTTEQELFELYNDEELNIEVRITPIIGPDSGRAGRGAYCANEQGKFSEYHNNVLNFMWNNYYESGNFSAEFDDVLTSDRLAEINSATGLDLEKFKACTDSDKFNPKLDQNLLDAADDSIRGTPGFVVGDQSFVGLQPLSVFSTLINSSL